MITSVTFPRCDTSRSFLSHGFIYWHLLNHEQWNAKAQAEGGTHSVGAKVACAKVDGNGAGDLGRENGDVRRILSDRVERGRCAEQREQENVSLRYT